MLSLKGPAHLHVYVPDSEEGVPSELWLPHGSPTGEGPFYSDPCTIRCTSGGCHSVDIHPGRRVSISALAREPSPAVKRSFYDTGFSFLEHGVPLHLFTMQRDSKEHRLWKPRAF